MKIDLTTIDPEQFYVNSHELAGQVVYLVHPKNIGIKWTRENLIYRSSVWDEQGELVSASFKKFFNWGEKPDLAAPPTDLKGCELVEKVDGSTLIVSKLNGEFIIRTRGCMTPHEMEKSGHEIELLKQKYPAVFADRGGDGDTWDCSDVYEWVSPANKIVINYGDEPELYLIASICHAGYTYLNQPGLDFFAKEMGVKRPRRFNFDSVAEMLKAIEQLQGQEGLCCYFNEGQDILKVKSAWYLAIHRMKSELASIDKVIDLWITLNKPDYQTFYDYICSNFDFELAQQNRGFISRICEAKKEVDEIIAAMHNFVDTKVHKIEKRADQAKLIILAYGKTSRSGFCFTILDKKPLDDEAIKKLLYQCLKK